MTTYILSKLHKIIKLSVAITAITALFVSPMFWLVRPAHAVTPAYKQGANNGIGSGASVSQAFSSANTAGDLIVVYVIWSINTNATVSVTDSRNTYTAVAPPTQFDNNHQRAQVFYAKNIGAGSNTVKATFSPALTSFADMYIQEFSGVNKTSPLDTSVASIGSTSPASSGSLITTNANDLLFAAGAATGNVSTIGTGFTSARSFDGNRTAYKNVTAAGTYSSSASVSGNWEMTLVAFKADSGTPADTTPPSVPTGLTATAASEKQVNLSWVASTDDTGVAGYKVFRNGTQVGTSGTTTYSDTNLVPATSYSYTVSAYDAAGNNSAQSSSASATTLADTTAPSVPANLAATVVSNTQINLSWNASSDNIGVTGYKVLQNGVEIALTAGTTYQNTGLSASTTYTYTVRATDAAGNVSADSNQVSATTQATPDTTPPSVPTGLTATPVSSSQINLGWTASPESDTAGYRIFRNGVSIATTVGTSYSDTGLAANTTYNYTVAAYDNVPNESAQSGVVSATTQPVLDTTPAVRSNGAPTGTLPSSTTATTLSLTTNEPATCKYATTAGTAYSAMLSSFTTSNNTSHSAALSGLTAGQSYSYYVRCQDFASNVNPDDYIISFSVAAPQPPSPFSYERVVIDSSTVPADPWMKSLGDVNGDGTADIVVSGHYGPIVWYDQTQNWHQNVIATGGVESQSGSDMGDIDGDGDNDVAVGAKWYENPGGAAAAGLWTEHALPGGSAGMTHDVMVADLNGDGKKDILMRGESSSPIDIFLQTNPTTWTKFTIDPGSGLNGLEVADINNDGKKDVIIGGVWMENPGANLTTPSAWVKHSFANWQGYASVQAIDMNGDGRLDLLMSVSEGVGNLSWFEQLTNGSFTEHQVATGLNSVHRVFAQDVDKDGLLDIVASEYGDSGEKYFNIYRNLGGATSWQRSILNTDFGWPSDGLHNVHSADINGDCKPDFFGSHDTPSPIVIVYRSTGASACGPADTTAPTTPTGLTGSAPSSTQVNLSWNSDATDNVAVTGYVIYRNNVQVGTTNDVSTVTYQDTNLSANTTYNYEVSARDAAGNLSPRTAVFSITTPTPPVDTTPPVISAVVSSTISSSSATITWTTDEPADSQINYGTTVAYGSQTTLNTALVTSHSVVVNGLTPNTTYHYQVLSRDSSGNAAASADFSFTTTAASPIAFVQATGTASSINATSISQTFISSVTAGNAIVAAVSWDSAGGSILNVTCSDNRGDAFAVATNVNDSTNSQTLAICYAVNVAGGATTVTATFNGSASFRNISINEYSGIATTNPVDVTKTNIANGTTAVDNVTSSIATTISSGDLIFGAVMDDTGSNANITAGTGFTRRSFVGADLATEDKVQSSAGSVATTFTFATAHRYLAQMVAFRAAF